jgi:DNA-directed RNA polymerase specialized sigma24 family protein
MPSKTSVLPTQAPPETNGAGVSRPAAAGGRGPSRLRRLWARLAGALGFRRGRSGLVPMTPIGTAVHADGSLEHLAQERKPKIQAALLVEALALLDEADRRVLAARLPGGPYEAVAEAMGISIEAAGPRYASAVDRLCDRLTWVAIRERRGMSPPERRALGQVQFFGRSAQEIARRLRLPEEAVERWIRRAHSPSLLEGGPMP